MLRRALRNTQNAAGGRTSDITKYLIFNMVSTEKRVCNKVNRQRQYNSTALSR